MKFQKDHRFKITQAKFELKTYDLSQSYKLQTKLFSYTFVYVWQRFEYKVLIFTLLYKLFQYSKRKKLEIENQIKTEEHVDLVLVPLVNINNNR